MQSCPTPTCFMKMATWLHVIRGNANVLRSGKGKSGFIDLLGQIIRVGILSLFRLRALFDVLFHLPIALVFNDLAEDQVFSIEVTRIPGQLVYHQKFA